MRAVHKEGVGCAFVPGMLCPLLPGCALSVGIRSHFPHTAAAHAPKREKEKKMSRILTVEELIQIP